MKYLFLFAFCAFMSFPVFAQKYVPFPKHGAVWLASHSDESSGSHHHLKQEGDTIINGLTYTLLSNMYAITKRDQYGHFYEEYYKGYHSAMREDSFKHVYFYDFTDKRDTLLYDFNLKVGDTLPAYTNPSQYQVLKIDSVLIGSVYRKRFGIIGFWHDSIPIDAIIEGIGSTQGLTSTIIFPFEAISRLECFSLNGKSVYPDTSYKTCEIIVSVNKEVKKDVKFTIFPNPTIGQFTIQTQSIFSESDICVRDVLGRIVLQEKLQSPNQTFNIANQLKGLYFVELKVGEKKTIQKLILE
jgi:hypothetical protein